MGKNIDGGEDENTNCEQQKSGGNAHRSSYFSPMDMKDKDPIIHPHASKDSSHSAQKRISRSHNLQLRLRIFTYCARMRKIPSDVH